MNIRHAIMLAGSLIAAGAWAQQQPLPIESKADRITYEQGGNLLELSGHAIVIRGDEELRADVLRVNVKSEDVYGFGNVVYKRGSTVWTGEKLHYNFKTGMWDSGAFESYTDPFRIQAGNSKRISSNEYVLADARVTTCKFRHPNSHYSLKAREVTVLPGEAVKAKSAVLSLGSLPVMWVPYWYQDTDESTGLSFRPGYRSRVGAYLLTGYTYGLQAGLKGTTHLDYRTKRGLGGGQDFEWKDGEGQWAGDFSSYYLSDKEPWDEHEDPATSLVEKDRYRVGLRHWQAFGERNYMLSQGTYLSDPDVLKDFFEKEYRNVRQPENFLDLSHRGDSFTANLEIRARLNDFYSNINRLPEASVSLDRQQIRGGPLYYDGQTRAGFLQQVWEETADSEDYDAFRFHTDQAVYYPTRHWGFLNFVPRIGYHGTYYSKSHGAVERVETGLVTTTNAVVGTNSTLTIRTVTTTNIVDVESGSVFRSLVEVGAEASFKAFRTWGDGEGRNAGGYRHVVEPYVNYTLVPNENIDPADIYQFDSIDLLGEQNGVRLGVRNKLQRKREERPFNVIDADVFTTYRFLTEADEDPLDIIYVDTEARPCDWFLIDFDAQIDPSAGELALFNTQMSFLRESLWRMDVEYRHRNAESGLLSGMWTYSPNDVWTFEAYGRYEFEGGRLEEHAYSATHKWDCLAVSLGLAHLPGFTRSDGYEEEDDYRVLFQLWLTAFPDVGLGSSRSQ